MPTDDMAQTITPPVDDEHESPLAGRFTCPPEELRIHSSPSHNTTDDNVVPDASAQQPTPPPANDPASPARTPSPSDSHPKPTGASVEGPIRDIPTPMSALDDSPEEQRHALASPLSATAPSVAPWSQQRYSAAPQPLHRVRTLYAHSIVWTRTSQLTRP